MSGSETTRREELKREFLESQRALGDLLIGRRLESLARIRLTGQQLRLLAILLLDGERAQTELAALLGISGATVSGLVDRLVATGMAERHPHPSDGRIRLVSATVAAAATLREAFASEPTMAMELLESLTVEELEHLTLGTAALLRVLRGGA